MSKTKCPSCGSLSIRSGATKCPSCQAWVTPPKFAKRRLRLSPVALVIFAAGLGVIGMVAGVFAAVTAVGRRPGQRPPPLPPPIAASSAAEAEPASSASAVASAMPSPSASVAAAPPAKVEDPPAEAGKFVKTEQVRLDAPPVDILYSADETLFFVLADDGTVRAHDAATGAEKRRVKLPGRGKGLRALPGSRFAVLGLPAELAIVDVGAWREGGPDATFLKRAAVRDVVDIAAVGDPPVFVAATGQGGKVLRLSADLAAIEAEFVSAPPVQSLASMQVADADRIVMFADGRLPADSAIVSVFDPSALPFGASRAFWSPGMQPRTSQRVGLNKLLVFELSTGTLVDFAVDAERRMAPAGAAPMAAFRWNADRAVVIGAAGQASVVSFAAGRIESTVALGALPAAAVATPDLRVAVVALGGGPLTGGVRGRGATTVVLSGEPLSVESTVETGEGSNIAAISPKGALVAVGATVGRTITLLSRK